MPYSLEDKLVVGISGRALFDLAEEHDVYTREGIISYRRLQRERENSPLKPGTGFPLAKALLSINSKTPKNPAVEIVVISRNDGNSGLRIMNSIAHHGLGISRASFCGGATIHEYSKAYNCKLFLSAEEEDVRNVIENGGAAGLVYPPPDGYADDARQVRIAFDADAVIFSDEAEKVYQERGMDEFRESETSKAQTPLKPGPFKPFLESLAAIQARYTEGPPPIRTAVVTSRDAPAHKRAILTLREWGIAVDEMHFLGGIEKTSVLRVFKPHIFFDDQPSHVLAASKQLPSAQVPYGVVGAKKAPASVRSNGHQVVGDGTKSK